MKAATAETKWAVLRVVTAEQKLNDESTI